MLKSHIARLAITGSLLAIILLLPAGASALQILTPADGAIITSSGHLVVKAGEAPAIDGLTIDINGVDSEIIPISSPAYRKAFRDFLIVKPDFDPGENRILVKGYAGGKPVAEARARVYLTEDPDRAPAGFEVKPFHVTAREALCEGCHHNLKPSAEDLAVANPARHPCASCHAGLINRKHVHGPAGVFECTSCHDPGSAPARYALIADGEKLCSGCHEDNVRSFRKSAFVHGPVAAGLCLVCHDPHASDSLAQIRGTVNASCLRCHDQVKVGEHVVRGVGGKPHPLEGNVNPADPAKPLNCASCHDPHGGQVKSYLRGNGKNLMGFCLYCHKK